MNEIETKNKIKHIDKAIEILKEDDEKSDIEKEKHLKILEKRKITLNNKCETLLKFPPPPPPLNGNNNTPIIAHTTELNSNITHYIENEIIEESI